MKSQKNAVPKKRPNPKGGRPPFEPTELQRKQVRNFRAYGVPIKTICTLVFDPPIAKETLLKHFARELDLGIVMADVQVVESLHMQAVGTPAVYDEKGNMIRAEQPRVPSAGIFWAKARMGWRDVQRTEITGKDGAPLIDLSKLSDTELDLYEKLLRKAHADNPGADPGGTDQTRH